MKDNQGRAEINSRSQSNEREKDAKNREKGAQRKNREKEVLRKNREGERRKGASRERGIG